MKKVMKVLKVLGWVLLGLVTLIVVFVLALPLWIGPVACGVANRVTPGITKTDFHLGHFALNPYSGHIEVGDMQLANPTNFSEKNAVDLGLVTVDLATTSLISDTIYIKDISINGLKVYLDAPDVANFKQIAANAAGEDEEEAAELKEDVAEESAATNETRVVIDRIRLKNVVLQYGMLPIPLPDFEIKDIGRDATTGEAKGATWLEAWLSIIDQISAQAQGLGKGLFKLGKHSALAVTGAATNALTTGFTSLTNLTSSTTDGMGEAGKAAEKALNKGMNRAMKEADKAVKLINGFFGSDDKK